MPARPHGSVHGGRVDVRGWALVCVCAPNHQMPSTRAKLSLQVKCRPAVPRYLVHCYGTRTRTCTCTTTLQPVVLCVPASTSSSGRTLSARFEVTTRQRPSDWLRACGVCATQQKEHGTVNQPTGARPARAPGHASTDSAEGRHSHSCSGARSPRASPIRKPQRTCSL